MSLAFLSAIGLQGCVPLHEGLAYAESVKISEARLLVDESWVDAAGSRHVDQEIFDAVFRMIDEADQFVLLDFFLVNQFMYEPGPVMRDLSQELTDCLLAKRAKDPEVMIIFITDPVNSVYGSIELPLFSALEQSGVDVVWTDLDRLRDSNWLYSKCWRLLIKPWGTGPGDAVSNPLGAGRISRRSLFKLMNFKANHRKVVVTDRGVLVTSANPHSASSAHWNTALKVDGGIHAACAAESAILSLSGASPFFPERCETPAGPHTLELLTESAIREKALAILDAARADDRVDLTMFYLSHHDLIEALINAHRRGASVRVVLDPAKDAFGRVKSGIPNRQAAARLVKAGVPLRWAHTHGEQCHVKMLYADQPEDRAVLLLGSSNYTRRNLDNLNAELDVALTSDREQEALARARTTFDRWWANENGRHYTVEYDTYADPSRWRRIKAWWMERSGFSTF